MFFCLRESLIYSTMQRGDRYVLDGKETSSFPFMYYDARNREFSEVELEISLQQKIDQSYECPPLVG